MATIKQIALGTILEIDPAGGTTYAAQTLIAGLRAHGRSRALIDGTALGDTYEEQLLGIEESDQLTFEQFWQPSDTNHELIDTAFDNKDEIAVRITHPHTGDPTEAFDAKVISITPAEAVPTGAVMRTVTLLRTGAVTKVA